MLVQSYAGTITKNLTPSSISKMMSNITAYVDRNSEILMTMDLCHRYSFTESDREVVYNAMGIEKHVIEASIKDAKAIHNSNKIQSNPFYASCMLCMNKLLSLKKEKEAKMVMLYMQLMMYTSVHKGFFEHEPNPRCMDYTIAHLDNSYIIRRMASLFEFLSDNSNTTFTTYKNRIESCKDEDITWVVDALWTRTKGKMKKIANAFYVNHKSGNYLNLDSDSIVEGDYHEADSDTYAIDRLTNKVYTRLVNRQYDKKYIKYSITSSDVSADKLSRIIVDIIDGDDDEVLKPTISALIEYFVYQSGKTIDYVAKGEYIVFMQQAYASNSNMEQLLFVKGVIDKWLVDNMYKYGKANYGATVKNQYRKSIYRFLVFTINHEAKR